MIYRILSGKRHLFIPSINRRRRCIYKMRNALFSIGLVLFLFIMLINVFLNVFIKRKKED